MCPDCTELVNYSKKKLFDFVKFNMNVKKWVFRAFTCPSLHPAKQPNFTHDIVWRHVTKQEGCGHSFYPNQPIDDLKLKDTMLRLQ